MGRNGWSYEALIDRIRSPIAAAAILLGIFVAMSLVAAGVVRLLSPHEEAADIQANPAIEHSAPEAASSVLAGARGSRSQTEDTNVYTN
jgi:hypothetical protein